MVFIPKKYSNYFLASRQPILGVGWYLYAVTLRNYLIVKREERRIGGKEKK